VLVDTVGGRVAATVLPWVRPGGKAVLIGYLAGTTLELDLPAFMQRDVSIHPLNMIRREHQGRAAADELLSRLGDGRLRVDVTEFPLEGAAAALDWLVEPGHRGRAVLVPHLPGGTS
jgi:NADPH:quinone reductase